MQLEAIVLVKIRLLKTEKHTLKLYLLYHNRWIDDKFYDTKTIGVYSSYEKASDTIERYSHLSGFSEFSDGFHLDSFDITKRGVLKNGMVYLSENISFLGADEIIAGYNIYSNKISAVWNSMLMKKQKGYKKFYIVKYKIDEDNWSEGFTVMKD